MPETVAQEAKVAGLHLFSVGIRAGENLWITTPRKDFGLAAKRAKKLLTDKKSAFYGLDILGIEYQGTIDA